MPNLSIVNPGQIIEANDWNDIVNDLNPLTQALEIVDTWGDGADVQGGDLIIKGKTHWDIPNRAGESTLYFGDKDTGYFIKAIETENPKDSNLTLGARDAAAGFVITKGGDARIGGSNPSRAKLEIDGGDEWVSGAWHKSLLLAANSPSIGFTSKIAPATKFGIGLKHENGVSKLHVFSTISPLDIGVNTGEYKSRLTVQENGNVGIGTDAPTHRLEVNGHALVKGPNKDFGSGSQANLYLGDTEHFIRATWGSGVTISTHGADPGIFLEQVKGNVGIGTDAPSAKLEVSDGGPLWTNQNWRKAIKIGNGNAIQFDAGVKDKYGIGASSSGNSIYFFHTDTEDTNAPANYRLILTDKITRIGTVRPIILKANNGGKGIYGSEIGFNAILNTEVLPNKFIKLGATSQRGGASIAVDFKGDISFQMYDADTEDESIIDYKPQIKFTHEGKALKNGGSNWDELSDHRVKKNTKKFTESLEKLKKLNPVSFEYNGQAETITGMTCVGLIAQELQVIFPFMVSSYKGKLKPDDKEEDIFTINTSALIYVVINAIKELEQRLKNVEK